MALERLRAPTMPLWLESQLPFTRYCVDVGGHRMHVMETGEGFPVLLLHGNPSWGFLYRRVAAELADADLRLIMPDLIGLGLSDKPYDGTVHQLDNHIRWMARLIELLELDRCVVAIQDWGGCIGVGALAEHPQIRAGLVVMNTVVTPPKPGFKATAFHRLSQLPIVSDLVFRWLGFPQNLMGQLTPLRRLTRDERRAYTWPMRHRRDRTAPLWMARMVPDNPNHPSIAPMQRCRDYVDAFDGPAAIVWGDRDPVLGSVRSWMQKLFPEAPVTRTSAGHFLQEEVPREIADAIRQVAATLQVTA